MNICGVVVHVQPQRIDAVTQQLITAAGVEVHAAAADGRLVVTVEEDSSTASAEKVMAMQNIAGVLSAALVYQYSDDHEHEHSHQNDQH